MIPKIKKKASLFFKDEKGTISKKNLIKGAITLSGISSIIKGVKAVQVKPDEYYPGDLKELKLPALAKMGEGYECITTKEDLVVGPGEVDKAECHANNWAVNNGRGDHKNSHLNNVNTTHKNTDKNFHKNLPSARYVKTSKKLITQHSHHGQHVNASAQTRKTGASVHTNY